MPRSRVVGKGIVSCLFNWALTITLIARVKWDSTIWWHWNLFCGVDIVISIRNSEVGYWGPCGMKNLTTIYGFIFIVFLLWKDWFGSKVRGSLDHHNRALSQDDTTTTTTTKKTYKPPLFLSMCQEVRWWTKALLRCLCRNRLSAYLFGAGM